MAKILNGAGFRISGRIGKSEYIGRASRKRVRKNILAVEQQEFKELPLHKKMRAWWEFSHKVYKAYSAIVALGLPQKGELNSRARFLQLNFKKSIADNSSPTELKFEVKPAELVLGKGRADELEGLVVTKDATNVKLEWVCDTSEPQWYKDHKIAVAITSDTRTLRPVVRKSLTTRNTQTATLPLGGLTGAIHVFVLVYGTDAKGKPTNSDAVYFKLA